MTDKERRPTECPCGSDCEFCWGGDACDDWDEERAKAVDPKLRLVAGDRERVPDPWAPKPGRLGWWRWLWEMLK